MSKLIKVLFGVYVVAATLAAFPAMAVAAEGARDAPPIIFKAVISDTAMIDGLNAGILGGPGLTIEVQGPSEDFQPNAKIGWGCFSVEDIIEIASPVKSEFYELLRDKIVLGQCFAGGPYPVVRLEKQTMLPAEGDRPVMVIWSVMDSRGVIAYASGPPDDES